MALPTVPDTAGITKCVQQMSVLPYVMHFLSEWMSVKLFSWLMMILMPDGSHCEAVKDVPIPWLALQHHILPVKSVKLSHLKL
jgi:hypothetical protein